MKMKNERKTDVNENWPVKITDGDLILQIWWLHHAF